MKHLPPNCLNQNANGTIWKLVSRASQWVPMLRGLDKLLEFSSFLFSISHSGDHVDFRPQRVKPFFEEEEVHWFGTNSLLHVYVQQKTIPPNLENNFQPNHIAGFSCSVNLYILKRCGIFWQQSGKTIPWENKCKVNFVAQNITKMKQYFPSHFAED
jgi:hypothetical protein